MLYQLEKIWQRLNTSEWILPLSGVCGLIFVWEAIFFVIPISPLVLVRPSEFVPAGIASAPLILHHLAFTITTAATGWSAGLAIGFLLAVCAYHIPGAARYLLILSVGLNAIPLIALIAIMSGILGTTQQTKIIITSIFVIFPTIVTCIYAFSTVPKSLQSLFHLYAVAPKTTFLKLTIPHSLPHIIATMKITMLSAFLTSIVTEFFGSQRGVGQFILANKGLYRLPLVWATLVFVVAAGVLWYGAIGLLEKLFRQHKINY